MPTSTLNPEQSAAIIAIQAFLSPEASDQRFFLLSGFAGTGKTYCIRHLIDKIKGRLIFTAPTNKATKVLRDTLTTAEYKPETRTIYSLLAERKEPNRDNTELTNPDHRGPAGLV